MHLPFQLFWPLLVTALRKNIIIVAPMLMLQVNNRPPNYWGPFLFIDSSVYQFQPADSVSHPILLDHIYASYSGLARTTCDSV